MSATAKHQLIGSRFLDDYLIVHPGSTAGIKVPQEQYAELERTTRAGETTPYWLIKAARRRWALDLPVSVPASNFLLLREKADPQYSRASWEINLGCNYDCEHCYLGEKKFEGLSMEGKAKLLRTMQEVGVLWLQITGGEPTVDRDFADSYTLAYELGMLITVSTNGSRLWQPKVLDVLTTLPAYRVVVSVYGASAASYDGLTRRKGSFATFQKGMAAALEAGIPMRLNLVVTERSAHEEAAMVAMAEDWGLEHNSYVNMAPTIYGGGETLPAQSAKHLRQRKVFSGCNAGHTFFHSDPYGVASICKVGRDPNVDLMAEGVEGLRKLGAIADSLMLRTGGCSGCTLSGSCGVCRPMAKLYQEAKAPLGSYCQHGRPREEVTA
ncbi:MULTISPECIES: radical SAM protein [unclassified Kitasatospora]|uniref:radical SAM protein n=1 Tax=unclassified Kitasatospora TaxID=2633591 RepID=UPI00070C9ECA|nr:MULTISPECIES: radical SAM protein [unclassified Kitasatospora]KQV12425.1 radical SAM protein [Kitasatospora sp. Root107]KRB66926.1 radical SAM protein [Kitasatospora sp. Root187]